MEVMLKLLGLVVLVVINILTCSKFRFCGKEGKSWVISLKSDEILLILWHYNSYQVSAWKFLPCNLFCERNFFENVEQTSFPWLGIFVSQICSSCST